MDQYKREKIDPTSEEEWLDMRTKDITSTEIASLFGASNYLTEFELWYRKKEGFTVKLEQDARMKWGNVLQDAIANAISEDQIWVCRKKTEYMRIPELKIGSSFDFEIQVPIKPTEGQWDSGLLEIKNVDSLQFKNGWLIDEDGSVEAPLYIEFQAQHQLLVSGLPFIYIGALVGGNSLQLIRREPSKLVFNAIFDKTQKFWKSIEENKPPQPDFKRDAEFISQIYKYAEPGKVEVVGEEDRVFELAKEYKEASEIYAESKEKREAIKAEIFTLIGDAEKVKGPNLSISAGMVSESPRNFMMPAFRMFRVTWGKGK